MNNDFNIISAPIENIKFTKDQEIAVKSLIEFIASSWDERKFINALCGAGGVGKTFVTKYIINNCKFSRSVIKCAATTHKACRVLSNAINGHNVSTIQSILGLRLDVNIEDFDPNNPAFNPIGKDKLEGIRLLIIDESSMLNYKLVNYIAKKCKNQEIKVIFIGDASQLPPVNEVSSYAFKIASNTYYLNEIVRQSSNNPISNLLELLRYDIANKHSWKFLDYINKHKQEYNSEGLGYCVRTQKEFIEIVDTCFHDEEYTKDIDMYRVVAYTNNKVNQWNNHIRKEIIANSDISIITRNDLIMSYTTIVNEFNEIVISNSEEYIIKDILDTVEPDYQFVGFMIKFQSIHGGDITKPLFVINHTDSYTFQMYYNIISGLINDAKTETDKGSRASKWKKYFEFKRKYLLATNYYDSNGKILINRDIDYGFAITSHRAQGSTYKSVFVDLNDIVYDKNNRPYTNRDELLRRLYVACSRASKNLIISYGK